MTGRLVVGVAVGLLVSGCAAFEDAWNAWFDASPSPSPVAAPESSDVFYARSEGLALHELPTASSPVIARLALYQRVTRIGLSRGYANVATDAGLTGWVDNTDLLWRLPGTPAAPAAAVDTFAIASDTATPAPAVFAATPVPTAAAIETPPTSPPPADTPAALATTPTAPPVPTPTGWRWRNLLPLPRR